MILRVATEADANRISVLCGQLGYPSSAEEALGRLRIIFQAPAHAAYVAQEEESGNVVGWVHVFVPRLLVSDSQAEIGGLVVDEGSRWHGVGRMLMRQAEEWALAQGCRAIRLRSNVVREGAHGFYERLGYSRLKTQTVFRKSLARESAATVKTAP